jgi:hypothetical protein
VPPGRRAGTVRAPLLVRHGGARARSCKPPVPNDFLAHRTGSCPSQQAPGRGRAWIEAKVGPRRFQDQSFCCDWDSPLILNLGSAVLLVSFFSCDWILLTLANRSAAQAGWSRTFLAWACRLPRHRMHRRRSARSNFSYGRRLTLYFFLLAAFGLAAIISYRSRASCYIIVSVPPPRPCRMGKAERRQAGSRRCLQH